MPYEARDYARLLGTEGFSDQLLNTHFTLYKGYVTNTNTLMDQLGALHKEAKSRTPVYAELKRRFGWEFNGMRLHEYYFGNMAKGGISLDPASPLQKKISEDFGSLKNWEDDFKSTGVMRGIGWVMLYYDIYGGRLFNSWIDEHANGHLSGACPVLIMDVFEHAFITDYGLKRADYIEAFFKAIDWTVATKRFGAAASGKPALD
jgi:superoxide dismutase, Fe-Mn family